MAFLFKIHNYFIYQTQHWHIYMSHSGNVCMFLNMALLKNLMDNGVVLQKQKC